jgi:hypothetical protein
VCAYYYPLVKIINKDFVFFFIIFFSDYKMPKRLKESDLGNQSQVRAKWTLQDIEENSVDQLIVQPIPAFKETLKKLLADNCEEIARLANLNKKILECLDRIDQQDKENVTRTGVATSADVAEQNTSKVSLTL